jgi:hypothetical protein
MVSKVLNIEDMGSSFALKLPDIAIYVENAVAKQIVQGSIHLWRLRIVLEIG